MRLQTLLLVYSTLAAAVAVAAAQSGFAAAGPQQCLQQGLTLSSPQLQCRACSAASGQQPASTGACPCAAAVGAGVGAVGARRVAADGRQTSLRRSLTVTSPLFHSQALAAAVRRASAA